MWILKTCHLLPVTVYLAKTMKRNWIQCVPGEGLGRWRVPQATMDRRGDIMLSRVTWELLGEPEVVLVFFNARTNKPCAAPKFFVDEMMKYFGK